jgi:hypothetical protein
LRAEGGHAVHLQQDGAVVGASVDAAALKQNSSLDASMDLQRQLEGQLKDVSKAEGQQPGQQSEFAKPDCSNCREPAPPAAVANVTDDTQCCVGLPTELAKCSEFLPESVFAFVNNTAVTDSWRGFDNHGSIRCNEFDRAAGKCDPCKVGTDYEASRDLYCEPSSQVGRLRCYERTPEQYQIVCRPRADTNWYGGWDVVDMYVEQTAGGKNILGYDQRNWEHLKCKKR